MAGDVKNHQTVQHIDYLQKDGLFKPEKNKKKANEGETNLRTFIRKA